MGLKDHSLFRLTDSGDSWDLAMAAQQSSVSTLCHQRYGYLNVHCLSQLAQDELVLGLPKIQTQQLGVFDACQARKQHRTPFTRGDSWRISQVLQLVHAYICGPMASPSILGSRSTDGRAPVAPAALVIPVIPIQTPSTSPVGSPQFVDASPEFDPDSSDEEYDHQASPNTNVDHSLWPKWWAKTLANLHNDELIDGRTAQKKSKPTKFVNFSLMANIHSVFEPQTYSEANKILEGEQAMTSEHQILLKNNIWVLSDHPLGKKPIGCKWVYKIKYKSDGTLDKYKAHLVAKGFSQR